MNPVLTALQGLPDQKAGRSDRRDRRVIRARQGLQAQASADQALFVVKADLAKNCPTLPLAPSTSTLQAVLVLHSGSKRLQAQAGGILS